MGPELLRLFGKNFKNGYTTLLILLFAAVPQGLAVALYQIIQSQAKMWLSFLAVAVPRDALIVILAYLLIPTRGASGVAFGYAAAWSVALLIIGGLVYRIGLEPTGRPSDSRGKRSRDSDTPGLAERTIRIRSRVAGIGSGLESFENFSGRSWRCSDRCAIVALESFLVPCEKENNNREYRWNDFRFRPRRSY